MTQLSWWNKPIAVFVEMTQAFDEVVGGVAGAAFGNRLVDWQKNFESDSFLWKSK